VTVKLAKRAYPATPERLQNKLFKAWYHLSSFTLLLVVVAAAGAAFLMDKRGIHLHVLGDLKSGLRAPSAPALGKFDFWMMLSPGIQVALLVRGVAWRRWMDAWMDGWMDG
jgi:hypothetical protein